MDQYSRCIIGFVTESPDRHEGNPSGVDIYNMFNSIISEHSVLSKYISTDNDPLFEFHRCQAKLQVLEINEIESTHLLQTESLYHII